MKPCGDFSRGRLLPDCLKPSNFSWGKGGLTYHPNGKSTFSRQILLTPLKRLAVFLDEIPKWGADNIILNISSRV